VTKKSSKKKVRPRGEKKDKGRARDTTVGMRGGGSYRIEPLQGKKGGYPNGWGFFPQPRKAQTNNQKEEGGGKLKKKGETKKRACRLGEEGENEIHAGFRKKREDGDNPEKGSRLIVQKKTPRHDREYTRRDPRAPALGPPAVEKNAIKSASGSGHRPQHP